MGNKTFSDCLLIVALSLVFCVGLVHYGMPRGHDIMYEITRVAEYSHAIKDSGFPVRWSANLEGGFGEPIFNFFPPLFLIISSIQIILGISIANAVKGSIFIFTLAGGMGMYIFARRFYERNGSLVSACIYIISPYHLVDVYARNAYSEYTACSLAPFVFWGITLICKERNLHARPILLLATSGAFFAISHNLSLLMYTPLFALFFFFNFFITKNFKSLLSVLIAGVLSLCLSAFYIIPALFEKKFIQTWQLTVGDVISKNYSTLASLFGFSSLYTLTPFSFILIILVLTAMIFKKEQINKALYANLCLFMGFFVILLFLTTSSSRIIWESFSFLKLFQFPWRLLSPVSFVLAFLAGSLVYFRKSYPPPFSRIDNNAGSDFGLPAIVLISFIFGSVFIFFFGGNSDTYVVVSDVDFAPENIRQKNLQATVLHEYRPIWVQVKKEQHTGKDLICMHPNTKIKELSVSYKTRNYKVSLSKQCVLTAAIHYFPGWKIYNNGNTVPFKITPQGLMEFSLSKGTHYLEIVFENTTARKVGNYLSIVGLVCFGVLFFIAYKKS
jgi:hypothetical protein